MNLAYDSEMLDVTSSNIVTSYYSRNRDAFLERQRQRRKTPAYKIKRNAQDRARYRRDKIQRIGKYSPSRVKVFSQKTTYYNIRSRLKSFTMTFDEYKTLLEKASVCAICQRPEVGKKRLSLDHNHTTGKIRGLLCGKCNTGLGNFRDDPKLLQNAIEYLQSYQN